jgi:pyridoxamine 5'-phosphate oxidase
MRDEIDADAAPEMDPFAQFAALMRQAQEAGLPEPTAMSVATASADGRPSVRMLLLKGVDARGFVFYTNLGSRKADELRENPHAALCFFWAPLELQVRVEGPVEPVSAAEADEYFASRPRGSQIGAWSSLQSRPLAERAELERAIEATAERFGDGPIPRPDFWSGFRLLPERIEFWYGRPSRLHDREVFTRDPAAPDGWSLERLYP